MKYIITRTSKNYLIFKEERAQDNNPCPELNPKLEKVIYKGKKEVYVWTLEIKNIVDFVNKVDDVVLLTKACDEEEEEAGWYDLPVLEIYDDYRE